MKKCKNCFYSTACMAFEELHVTGEETPCDNFLDTSMVVVLPCPVGSTVYEKFKDCEHCPNYHEVAYSDYVSCEDDKNLFDYDMHEINTSDECKSHIRTKQVAFNLNHIPRFGKSIFLTKNVIYIRIPDELTHLAGYQYGKTIFESIKSEMNYEEPITFVLPERIEHVSSSFIHGFFEEIMNHWCENDVYTKAYWISSIPNFTTIVQEEII